MNTYKVYFTTEASQNRKMLITKIHGYSEDDALLRAGISRGEVSSIMETYF